MGRVVSMQSFRGQRREATSWRGLTDDAFWTQYPGVIIVDKGGSGRQTYEVYVGGKQIGRGQRLEEAKDMIEAKIGPCSFERIKPEPIKTDTIYWGTVDWFGDPTLYYAAIPV